MGSTINDNEYIELKKYIEKEIFNFLRQEGVSYFEFSIESEDLKPYILKIFEDKAIQSEESFHIERQNMLILAILYRTISKSKRLIMIF